jgi:hypothetical protein
MNRYLIITCFLISILLYYYYKKYINNRNIQSFISKKNIILLGDSILNNELYVPSDKSIPYLLESNKDLNVINYAQDNATIYNTFKQLDKIPLEYNNKNTTIFLSAGGNNMLNIKYSDNSDNQNISANLHELISKYNKLVESIHSKLPLCKLYLLDLYTPKDNFSINYNDIQQWNHNIYKQSNNIIYLSKIINNPNDLTNIEPSIEGGNKIANSIYNSIY